MTTSAKRIHTLYLSSRNREDHEDPYSMIFEIPENSIRLDDPVKENMKVSLIYFKFNSDWSEIDSTNNQFSISIGGTTTNIYIIEGNYPFSDLARYITYSASGAFTCRWDSYTNKLIFSNSNNAPMTINFTNSSWQVLGFSVGDNGMSGTTIVSTSSLVPRQHTSLYMKLNGIILGDGNQNFSNLTSRQLQPTTILSSIPISSAPFMTQFTDLSVYGDKTALYLSNDKLNQISIDIVTKDGEFATFISDWEATLKVEIVYAVDPNTADIKRDVEQMKETLNRLLTLKVIGNQFKNNMMY